MSVGHVYSRDMGCVFYHYHAIQVYVLNRDMYVAIWVQRWYRHYVTERVENKWK